MLSEGTFMQRKCIFLRLESEWKFDQMKYVGCLYYLIVKSFETVLNLHEKPLFFCTLLGNSFFMQITSSNYRNEIFKCPYCEWRGFGGELLMGDFSEMNMLADVDCPKCHEMIGFMEWGVYKSPQEETPDKKAERIVRESLILSLTNIFKN